MNMMTPIGVGSVGASSIVLTSNTYSPIPKDPPQPSAPEGPFVPEEIVHAILTISGRAPNLTFRALTPLTPPMQIPAGQPDPIEAYVSDVATRARAVGPEAARMASGQVLSPFDFTVSKPCWVVVELLSLDGRWQFTKDEYGVTTKAPPGQVQRHCSLRHVYDGSIGAAGEAVLSDDCRVLYFGVVSRDTGVPPSDPNPGSEFVNFHTEFLQDDLMIGAGPATKVTKRLKIIFDPDVKNNGGTFPP